MTPKRECSVAFVSRGDASREPAFAALLASPEGSAARHFRPRDLNEVAVAVEAGTIKRVIFARLDDLLEGCWDEVVPLDQWTTAGVQVAFADLPDLDGQLITTRIYPTWAAWNRTRRRRKWIAGTILSALAIAAAFLLIR